VAETKACAADLGFLLLQGNCFRSDRFFPYAPLLELLRAYISAHAATAARDLKPLATALSRLLLAEARHQRTEVYELLLRKEEGYVSEAHAVGTEVFLLCLEGSFVAGPLDQEVLLMPGDALWFVADRPHGYRSSEGARAVAMMLYPAVM
jgi:quercetin dioxygenase-like cupin family protein